MKAVEVNKLSIGEVLNYACSKIVEQGYRCMKDGVCMYGDPEGGHCAVGWLLDHDNEELMDYEGPVAELLKEHGDEVPKFIEDNLEAFEALQSFHDLQGWECRKDALQDLRLITDLVLDEPHWQEWIEMGDDYEP